MKKLVLMFTALVTLTATQMVSAQKTIVDVAAGNDDFSTLVTAVKAADLAETLSSDGPFTVFAPNNAAFSKVDKATLTTLLKPENKSALAGILTYHVVAGKLTAADVAAALKKEGGMVTLETVNGAPITVMQKDGKIWLKDQKGNSSEIIATDVMASNGVIHVIDTVVMPE